MRELKSLAILMICVPALVLAGCGRDDGQVSQREQDGDTPTSDGGRATDIPSPDEISEIAEKNRQALTDAGNMSRPMRMGLAAWAVKQYSHETDTGYEKATALSGHKAMGEYDRESRYGAIRVFVTDRFIVAVEGNNITVDALQQALARIDLRKLASLASGS